MSTTTAGVKKRRRFGLTLRAWLGVVAAVALGFGIFDLVLVNPYRRERDSARTLTAMGGHLPMTEDTESWLGRLGLTWVDSRIVYCADLDHSRVTDADLALMADFRHNGAVYLRGTAITEEGVRHFDKLDLIMIDLGDCRITSADLTPAQQVGTMILAGNQIKELRLTHFAGALTTLDLSRTGIDDATLEPVTKLVALQDLDLSETNITDDSLIRHLYALPNLAWLNVGKTRVTSEGIRELQKKRPGLTIVQTPGLKAKYMDFPRPPRPTSSPTPR